MPRGVEKFSAGIPLKKGEHFTRARRSIRQSLFADVVAGRIEALVAELIGVAAAAIDHPDATDD